MKYTYLGHSSFLIEIDSTRIILDPFISPNEMAKMIDVNGLRCDYILLSHGHFDHVADTELIARNSGATIVAVYELASYYGAKDLKYHPMNTGGSWDFGSFKVKTVSAVHSSSLQDGTYAGNPVGFIVEGGGKKIYYSGDTALTMDMQLIGSTHQLDRAFLCMGDNFTMGIDDALMASDFIKCNNITAMHFDTFPYIRIDHQQTIAKFTSHNKNLVVPEIGKKYDV